MARQMISREAPAGAKRTRRVAARPRKYGKAAKLTWRQARRVRFPAHLVQRLNSSGSGVAGASRRRQPAARAH